MPRTARLVIPGAAHHVTQRGNNRAIVFRDDRDYRLYLELLHRHADENRLCVVGYCLMPNHVHLIVVPPDHGSLATVLHRTHQRCAQLLNDRYSTSGHLWQARSFSCPMEDAHLVAAMRYVERNPVRAGLVSCAWEYPWSSAAEHLGIIPATGMIDRDVWGKPFSGEEWRAMLHNPEDMTELKTIRLRTLSGRPLGDTAFVRAALEQAKQQRASQ